MGKKLRHMLLGQPELPFRTNAEGIATFTHPLERRALFVLGVLLLLLSVLYVYSVISSVMHVAAREEAAQEGSRLSAEVASLEARYLARTNSVTESYAKDHGFVTLSSRTFVDKVSSLSLHTAR